MWPEGSVILFLIAVYSFNVDTSLAQVGNVVGSVAQVGNVDGSLAQVGNVDGSLAQVGGNVDGSLAQATQGQLSLGSLGATTALAADPTVQSMAAYISTKLQTSKVLGPAAQFAIPAPADLFFHEIVDFTTRAGFCDPALANAFADSVKAKVPVLASPDYFDAIGTTAAAFLVQKGIANPANADAMAVKIVSAMELEGCKNGVTDTLSVMNAVGYGYLDVMRQFGMTDPATVTDLVKQFLAILEKA